MLVARIENKDFYSTCYRVFLLLSPFLSSSCKLQKSNEQKNVTLYVILDAEYV